MNQEIRSEHHVDDDNKPAGGYTSGLGIDINWQEGPVMLNGINGAFVEGVINAAIDRIQWYQEVSEGAYKCRQNALAITKLEEALHWLHDRTNERIALGVEGTHTP